MGKYVPSTSEEQQEMLKAVGVSSFDELYTVVPSGMKVDRLAIPEGKSELEVSGIVRAMAAKNKVYSSIFRGAGAYNHYIPSIVKSITGKEEFLTAYTPLRAPPLNRQGSAALMWSPVKASPWVCPWHSAALIWDLWLVPMT